MNAYICPILVCLFYNNNIDAFFIFFFLLIVNMKVSNLISLFPVIEIPIMTRALFIYVFIYSSFIFLTLTG